MVSKTIFKNLRSRHVPGDVPIAIHLPNGSDTSGPSPLPLLILLHGGDGSEQDLRRFAPLIDQAIGDGVLAPLVVAMPSARRSLYMDYRDGTERWETFIIAHLLPVLRRELNVAAERERTFVAGWSMGGLGSLRLAFKHPDLFGAVAAVEPAVEPALDWSPVRPHVQFWRPEEVSQKIFGSPIDESYWAANNPATIAKRDPARLFDLGIYLDVGDQDMLYLHEGVEFLHRVLFDAGIGHDYRLVHGAEHVGPSLEPRLQDALAFIGRQIVQPNWIDQQVIDHRAFMDERKRAAGLLVQPLDPRRMRGF